MWKNIKTLEEFEASSSMNLRLHRQSLMLSNYCCWNWLDSFCMPLIRQVISGSDVADHWIVSLTRTVEKVVRTRLLTATITPSDSRLPIGAEPYEYAWSKPLYDPEQQIIHMERTVIHIIQTWLAYPQTSLSRHQAWFVQALLCEINEDILLLDSTWLAYCSLQGSVFGLERDNTRTIATFERFTLELHNHPIRDISSIERSRLGRINEAFAAYQSILVHPPDPTTNPTLIPSPPDLVATQMGRLLAYIHELLPIINESNRRNIKQPTPLQKAVMHSPDKLLPFRERAPSRIMITKPGGPFDEEVIRSPSGIFSSTIWRGITYTTPLSFKHRLFKDLDDWESTLAGVLLKEDIKYCCDPAAYGVTNPHRDVSLAKGYWASSAAPDWENLVKDGLVAFDTFLRYLLFKPKRFCEIGDLASYLLTADYAYAGLVVLPTLTEVADSVVRINKGAAAALEILGLLKRRKLKSGYAKPNAAECRAVIATLFEFLDAHLTQQEKELMIFDGIFVEHMLCKWAKAYRRNLV